MSDCACGPDWIPSRLVHWFLKIPKGEKCFFHDACVEHDKDYEQGILSRAECDQKFLVKMITLATEQHIEFEPLSRAIRYYQFVRYGGGVSYNYHRIKRWKSKSTFKW